MRSLNYIAALLPVITSAYAGKGYDDGTTIVTQTRTITVCPVIDWATCDNNVNIPTWIDRDGAPPTTASTTSTVTGTRSSTDRDGKPISTSSGYRDDDGKTTTSYGDDGKITTTSRGYDDGPITTTRSYDGGYPNVTTSGYIHPNGTTTSTGSITTTTSFTSSHFGINSTTSTTSSSTTSGCYNSTRTAAPYDFGERFGNNRCNRPDSRDQWCDGKSVTSDTDTVYRTGNVRKYKLEIALASVNADGMSSIPSFTINGKTPGDPIVANWGDDVEITVINSMTGADVNATTIHWHGILQHGTNDQDGVPGVTECGIAPGTSRTYKWHASTYGTGWYHSHLLAQYGGGIRGPIIIHGPASSDYDLDMGAIMMDEKFTDSVMNMANWYAKNRGVQVASNYLLNGKNQAYGNATAGEPARWIVKSGKKHLFRIINSSAQSAFVFHIDDHKMTVISADMVPIQPYETEYLWIHSGQRYNVIVNADQPVAAYDVRGIVQTGCGTTIANNGLGQSNGILEYEGSCYATPSKKNLTFSPGSRCEDEPLSKLIPIVAKDAGDSATFAKNAQNMAGGTYEYALWPGTAQPISRWYFGPPSTLSGAANGTASKRISVNYELPTLQLIPTVGTNDTGVYNNAVFYNSKDQWVYWVIQNAFLTSHPMHLHGHDFAVLGQGYNKIFNSNDTASLNFKNPMRRDTVLLFGTGRPSTPAAPSPVAPQPGYTVIGFKTDNPGTWLMHCHIIWHADGGMGVQIIERPDEISDYYSKPEFQSECSNMKSYHAGGGRMKAEYESGLKKRHLDEHKFHGYGHGHAVRHEY